MCATGNLSAGLGHAGPSRPGRLCKVVLNTCKTLGVQGAPTPHTNLYEAVAIKQRWSLSPYLDFFSPYVPGFSSHQGVQVFLSEGNHGGFHRGLPREASLYFPTSVFRVELPYM